MSYLVMLTGVLLALGLTMSLVLGVVCLLMGVHLDLRAGLMEEWVLLRNATLLFVAVTVPIIAAWWSLRRRLAWWPYAQAGMWFSVLLVSLVFRAMLLG